MSYSFHINIFSVHNDVLTLCLLAADDLFDNVCRNQLAELQTKNILRDITHARLGDIFYTLFPTNKLFI